MRFFWARPTHDNTLPYCPIAQIAAHMHLHFINLWCWLGCIEYGLFLSRLTQHIFTVLESISLHLDGSLFHHPFTVCCAGAALWEFYRCSCVAFLQLNPIPICTKQTMASQKHGFWHATYFISICTNIIFDLKMMPSAKFQNILNMEDIVCLRRFLYQF